VNSNCLLRNELVCELTVRGVSSEDDVSLFHIVSCSDLFFYFFILLYGLLLTQLQR
jgi:hypothetical protein